LKLIPGVTYSVKKKEVIGSTNYRVLYVHKDRVDPLNEDEEAPTWDSLREKLYLKEAYPTTIIVERGKMTKSFTGFKPWGLIEPHVTNAKKGQDDKPKTKPRRRRFFDFLFPTQTTRGTRRDGGGRIYPNYGASPPGR
jgi:hypothetical protein